MTARALRAPLTSPLSRLRPEHWTADAACASPDVDSRWFDAPHDGETRPDGKARIDRAKAVCGGCPVIAECHAAIVPGDSGVRAGRLVGERNGKLIGPETPMKEHGKLGGAQAHYRRGEKPCGPCADVHNARIQELRAARKRKKAS